MEARMGFHLHTKHGHHAHGHDHDHDHDRDHDHDHSHGGGAPRAIVRALIITAIFMVMEFAGGWYSNSLALVSDATHMLMDVGALLLSLFAIWFARRPKTPTMSYGFHRAEILGALASGLLIWLIAGLLVYEAVQRLSSPPEVKGPVVIVIAAIGLVANLLSMRMLHGEKEKNINVRAAYMHILADSLGSVGALIAGLILSFSGWRIIDPIITIVFALMILGGSWGLMKESVGVLMESTPSDVDPAQVLGALEEIQGVKEVHDLHIWSVSSGRLALSVHLVAIDSEVVLQAANRVLEERFSITHTTIQVEHPERFQSERCYDCQ